MSIVEDGTGKADAESYAAIETISAYAVARGLTFVITGGTNVADAEAAARRGTVWLDATFRARFPGRKANGRQQALEWPRVGACDASGEAIASDEVPVEIINALCEAAIREKAAPGSLSPDVTPGEVVKREKFGSVEFEYATGGVSATSQRPIATVIDDILGSLLGPRSSGYSVPLVRA
jgi:hypothetical protein